MATSREEQIATLVYYQQRPDMFVRDVLGAEPEPYQVKALLACATDDRIAMHTAHGVGKTALCSWVVLWWMFCWPSPKAVTTAPTWRQVKDLLWAEIHYWLRRADLSRVYWHGDYRALKTRLELSEDVYATGESVQDPAKIEGYHAPNILYVIDEAKAVPDDVFESIEGALTSGSATGGRSLRLVVSTPGGCSGKLWRVASGEEPGWTVLHVSALESSRVDRDWIEEKRQIWGEDSLAYKTRVLGVFDPRAGDTVISLEDAERACKTKLDAIGPLEIGVDVARQGDDRTAICVRHGPCVLALVASEKRDTTWTVETVIGFVDKLSDRYQIAKRKLRIKVDDSGVGGGVTDQLRRKGYNAVGVTASSKPNEVERYKIRRDELWFGMADRVVEGRLDLTRLKHKLQKELAAELSAPLFELDSTDRRVVEPKAKTKRRINHSPDLADALLLAFATKQRAQTLGDVSIRGLKLQQRYDPQKYAKARTYLIGRSGGRGGSRVRTLSPR